MMVLENNELQLSRLRRASIEDIPEIMRLMNSDVKLIFGDFSLGHLIELSVLSISQLDKDEAVVGFLALTDHPNMPAIHPSAWEEWLWYFYNYENKIDLIARSIFHLLPLTPTVADPLDNIVVQSLFQRVSMQVKGLNSSNLQFLYVAQRVDVCPRMRIRKAVEEDNDDLVPILDRQCERLKELYGEFYISELIARHPESDRVLLVAEYDELAAGVMCLDTAVDYAFLNRHYNLAPFSGLMKKSDQDVSAQSGLQVLTSKDGVQGHQELSSLSTILDKSSQIRNDLYSGDGDLHHQESSSFNEDTPFVLNPPVDLCHKESLEFDIVNIEKHLMEVPKFLSYENFQSPQKPSVNPHESLRKKHSHHIPGESYMNFGNPAVSHQPPVKAEVPPVKTYKGPPNAFMIELFAMREDIDERHGFDILEVTFELFPTLEYCIITIPTESTVPLLLMHFSLVSPRANNCVTHSLYVVHRNSVDGLVRVRYLEKGDWSSVEKFTSDPRALSAMRECYPNSYVLLSRSVVIGMAILESTAEPLYLRARYLLSQYRTFSYHEGDGLQAGHGTIKVLVMSPAFQPHAQFFVREVLRHSGLTALYWTSGVEHKTDGSVEKRLMSIVGGMVPVRPMRKIHYDMDKMLHSNKYLQLINKNLIPSCLWLTTARLSSLPKLHVNRRIVVVGASRAGLSFLEALLFGPASSYLTFCNVTLVSHHGLPVVAGCLRAADVMCPHKGRYDDRQIKSLPFHYYLDVVHGVMVHINRWKQYIVVSQGRVYYDELVLTCGVQYQMPDYLMDLRHAEEQSAVSSRCAHTLFDEPRKPPAVCLGRAPPPPNVFLVNAVADANACLRAVAHLVSRSDSDSEDTYTVMVYGASAAAYCCVSALLEFGLPAACIVFVEPFPPNTEHALRINFFNNEYVDLTVNHSLLALGVRVYRAHHLHSWQQDEAGRVTTVRLLSHYRQLDVPCQALFYYGTRGVDLHAFTAINNCGLVYDGGVAVSAEFCTNDPRVFSAGTCTRPPRALRNHNSEDIGPMLAEIVLRRINPFVRKHQGETASDSIYNAQGSDASIASQKPGKNNEEHSSSPIVMCCTFPGKLHYLRVRAPSRACPAEVAHALDAHTRTQGTVLETWKGGYFSMRVSCTGRVCDVTCLRHAHAHEHAHALEHLRALTVLYHKHERLLGNLLERFQANMIEDLFEYFSQPWMYALYHQTFQELLQDVREEGGGKHQEHVPNTVTAWLAAHGESLGLYAAAAPQLAADYRYV